MNTNMQMSKRSANYLYVEKKIDHLKRMGLITGSHSGHGMNGGACPTSIYEEQKRRAKEREK